MNLDGLEITPFTINYSVIETARQWYNSYQYKYIDVPWFVSEEADAVTRPQHAKALSTKLGNLVGSGEQGFIQLMLDGRIDSGEYQTITPCFRDELELDALHQNNFIKLELIRISSSGLVTHEYLRDMCDHALAVMHVYKRFRPKLVETESGFDIVSPIMEIELGSYGIRRYKNYSWVYVTGVAEPRFSSALHLEDLAK